jgi:hypothetical protein
MRFLCLVNFNCFSLSFMNAPIFTVLTAAN